MPTSRIPFTKIQNGQPIVPFAAAILRYIPDAVAGEFVNVGLLVVTFAESGKVDGFKFGMVESTERIRAFFPSYFDTDDWTAWSQAFIFAAQNAALGSFNSIEDVIKSVYDPQSPFSSFQWGSFSNGASDGLEAEYRRQYNRLVSPTRQGS